VVQEERFDLRTRDFPKQLDLAKVCIYGLSILSASLFLFLPFINLLHPSPFLHPIVAGGQGGQGGQGSNISTLSPPSTLSPQSD